MGKSHTSRYTYGPVPSRRLGRSLGVDLVPAKTCDLNCVYCQLGATPQTTLNRAEYAPADDVVAETRAALERGPRPDYVTLAGSGEPTLHVRFGEVAARIRAFCDVPIALVTNGVLFYLPEVREACGAIDLILPTLTAADEATFRRIHRPHPGITLAHVLEGLTRLRAEFAGQIWLEVFLVDGVNTSDQQVHALRDCIERINPHRIQLNTAVRPPAEADVRVPPPERLEHVRGMLGPRAEIIAPAPRPVTTAASGREAQEVLGMLRRRPCTAEDVAAGLGTGLDEAVRHIRALLDAGLIQRRQRLYETYYEAAGPQA